jgi:rubredoxin
MGRRPAINPLTGKPGPATKPGRDGDRLQARARVNQAVQKGDIPAPCDLPCKDCGHVYEPGERRHEYDHHLGYSAKHHLDVESVCTLCHAVRDSTKKAQTHCSKGHEFTTENTILKVNGNRACRECRKAHDRGRGRDAAYWREYRKSRKEASLGKL